MKYRDQPCDRCGWKFPGFHICVDLSTPEPNIPSGSVAKKSSTANRRRSYETARSSPEWKAKIAVTRREYQDRVDRSHEERNLAIVALYKDGASIREVAKSLQIDFRVVMRVLHLAQADGLVTVRPAQRRRKDELWVKKTPE